MNMTNARKLPASRGGLVGIFSLAAAALIAVIGLLLLFMAWRTIEPGYVGIVFDKASHRVSNTADPGWTFVNPFTQSITKYPVSLQTLTMVQNNPEGRVQGDDSVKIGSLEGQTMNADVSVQYSVERTKAAELYPSGSARRSRRSRTTWCGRHPWCPQRRCLAVRLGGDLRCQAAGVYRQSVGDHQTALHG